MAEARENKGAPLGGALFVAFGILLSRLAGLLRMRVLAHYLGNSDAGDAFYAALKIPNFPQNLFGEGVLSASFIPVYAKLVSDGNEKEAGKVAGAIFAILALLMAIITLGGILATPLLIDVIAPGFEGEKRALTIHLVQIIFPGTGLLVLSAWCLGVLNSHHRFFLSYAAPVLWNGAIIAALLWQGFGRIDSEVAIVAAWGLVAGSLLQFLVQLPTALKLLPALKIALNFQLPSVREVIRNFLPVVFGRGVVQLSAYVDNILASFLPGGAVAALGYAQSIYMLPVSLFGMSVSASELPSLSSIYGSQDAAEKLRERIDGSLKRIAFMVVPSVAGFFFLGDAIVGLLYQGGQFTSETTQYVWSVVAGSGVGLLATTLGRIYSSTFYALRDTKTPLHYSIVRVVLSFALGWFMGLHLPGLIGIDKQWGTAGLMVSGGISGWIEYFFLRRKLNQKIGKTGVPFLYLLKLWVAALISAGAAFALKWYLQNDAPMLRGVAVLIAFGMVYFPVTALFRVAESRAWFLRLGRIFRMRTSK